ncbi:MAG: bifunctional phosphopantothenoylcysteine decarboxylase/phosphopantothenate--cysteine ligase CoaBC [Firmicutes bacterium]|nr:bifunctional phosphopantothenoylcysteine decarboxylase/phosphopantothenate--cysteine ligase CoaBC [Bacillota bacterium]
MYGKEQNLRGYKVVVGVSGGIAAYKTVDLVSLLTKRGAEVHVVMTKAAREFIGPVTFEAISGNKVHLDVFDSPPGWHFPHLELARIADAVVIAPATAHFIGRAACGMADDLMGTMLLACQNLVIVCPAMNVAMYKHPAVQANINKLREFGYTVVEPDYGRLACGDTGPGRLAETGSIIKELENQLLLNQDLNDYTILVTAGATREPIDPVRFISNRSSGKMGFAIARAARKRGARVILVSGVLHPKPPEGVNLIEVESAQEMYDEVLKHYECVDVVIKAAAVGDYMPENVASQKIKKNGNALTLELKRNPDILLELGKRKQHQLLVGFAAETQDVEKNAKEKIFKKNLDLMVANDVTVPGAGFGTDTNVAKLIFAGGEANQLPMMTKEDLSNIILDNIRMLKKSK